MITESEVRSAVTPLAHLLKISDAYSIIGLQAAIRLGQELGNDEQRNSFCSGGSAINAGEGEVHKVFAGVVLAAGYKYLLAFNLLPAVANG
jgi:hypothetical protein